MVNCLTDIDVETTFCIYCKSILTVDSEKQLGFHQSYANSFLNYSENSNIYRWLDKRRQFVYKQPITIVLKAFNYPYTIVLNHKETTSEVIEEIPESVDQLTNLNHLSIVKLKLKSVPDSIGNLQYTKSLYLDHNLLTSIPASLGNLSNLGSLGPSSNNLSSLPDSIGKLSNLLTLYLLRNSFHDFPDCIVKLHSLQILSLSSNFIEESLLMSFISVSQIFKRILISLIKLFDSVETTMLVLVTMKLSIILMPP